MCYIKFTDVLLLIGQYSSEKEPVSSSGAEAMSDHDRVSLEAVGETDTFHKSLMRDELLINAQKFTTQVVN